MKITFLNFLFHLPDDSQTSMAFCEPFDAGTMKLDADSWHMEESMKKAEQFVDFAQLMLQYRSSDLEKSNQIKTEHQPSGHICELTQVPYHSATLNSHPSMTYSLLLHY